MERREERDQSGEQTRSGFPSGTRKEARVALLPPVNNVLSPDEPTNQEMHPDERDGTPDLLADARTQRNGRSETGASNMTASHAPGQPSAETTLAGAPEPTPLRLAMPWVAALSVFVLIATLLLLLANNQTAHAPGTTAQSSPSAPTATSIAHRDLVPVALAAGAATARLVPTAHAGYRVYIDAPDGFLMQYPIGWDAKATSPGARFTDLGSDQTPLYWVQVDLPDPWALSDAGLAPQPTPAGTPTSAQTNAALAQSWVSYVMRNLASLYPNDDFIQNPAPTDTITFAGREWQYGSALIATRNVEVEVMATIYDGQPYIISLYGADGGFVAGQSLYFNTMLQTFTFLAPPETPQHQP